MHRKISPTLISISTVPIAVAQNLVFTALIARFWTPDALGSWMTLEAFISMLLSVPAVLADLVGYEMLKVRDHTERHEIYKLGTKTSLLVIVLLLPFCSIASVINIETHSFLLFLYVGVRLLGQPVLGTMSKRLYSDNKLSTSFILGSVDQILILLPAALVAGSGGSFNQAVAVAIILRILQLILQFRLLEVLFPWSSRTSPTRWSIIRLIRRLFYLLPGALPVPFLQNSISLYTSALLGDRSLAILNTHRTAAGLVGQISNALIEPKIPHMLSGTRRVKDAWTLGIRTLYKIIPFVPVLILIFPTFYDYWLDGRYPVNTSLFLILLMLQLFRLIQYPIAAILRSTNNPRLLIPDAWIPFFVVGILLVSFQPSSLSAFATILMLAELAHLIFRMTILRLHAFS